MTGLCASCVCETSDVLPVEQDGKSVLLCYACREGSVRLFTFAGGRETDRRAETTTTCNGRNGDGGRRLGSSTVGGRGGRG